MDKSPINYTIKYVPTGSHRAPMAGEWFRGTNGMPTQARFDFNATTFDILEEVIEVDSAIPQKD